MVYIYIVFFNCWFLNFYFDKIRILKTTIMKSRIVTRYQFQNCNSFLKTKLKTFNFFSTQGLDLSLTNDWASELRPSMRKLRHAMDGLLKTARLMHSVQRLQQDMQKNSANLEIMYRRDVCFSQAVSFITILHFHLIYN